MKNTKALLKIMMILPWLSVPFIGFKTFKRFLSGAVFVNLIVIIESMIARKRVWWWFYKRIKPSRKGETPFIWGPFLIGSLWIMKLTYGKLFRFLVLNLSVEALFSYIMTDWLKRLGIASLVRMKKPQLLLLLFWKAILLYAFQFVKEYRQKQNNGFQNC